MAIPARSECRRVPRARNGLQVRAEPAQQPHQLRISALACDVQGRFKGVLLLRVQVRAVFTQELQYRNASNPGRDVRRCPEQNFVMAAGPPE